MNTILNYVTAFWSVAVINCVQPVNWEYCYRIDQWLIPEVAYGIQVYQNPSIIYKTEREYLRSMTNE